MKRSLGAALLALSAAACSAPAPRVPFQTAAGWHASLLGGEWFVNDSSVEDTSVYGAELVLEEIGTSGWAVELGLRYAAGEGEDGELVFDPANPGATQPTLPVGSDVDTDFYELDFGVRQVYRPGERLQPYFGVGGAVLQARSEEHWVQPFVDRIDPAPDIPLTPLTDHERGEIRPGLYVRTGLVWNVLRDQLRDESEFPIAVDVRGLLSMDYSYLELTVGFGYGRW